MINNFGYFSICLSLFFCFYADISSAQDEPKRLFPIILSSEADLKKNQLVVKIVNQSTEELLLDWQTIKKIQLNYWFDVGGRIIDSGYTAETPTFLNSSMIQNLLMESPERFVRLPAEKELILKLSLDPLLKAVSPFINNFPDDDAVSVQVFGSAIAAGRFIDGKVVSDEKLAKLVSAGNAVTISKSDVIYMLSHKPGE